MRNLLFTLAALPVLAGCSLIPPYRRPALPISETYPSGPAFAHADLPANTTGSKASDIGWRDFFTDPIMQDLIALSLENNRDLRVAAEKVAAAQATYLSARANLFPTINAIASGDFERIPPGVSSNTTPLHVRSYSLGASAVSYELDLFGKIRSAAVQSEEEYYSLAETRLSTQISLIAQVASEYMALLADREALRLSQGTAESQRKSYLLRKLTLANGSATALDVTQAETTWRTAQASVAQYTRQAAQDTDEIVLLVGAPLPASLSARMASRAGVRSEPAFPKIPAGLPSDLLQRRPDVRAAEHTLLAANANIGAARAALYPSVTLTGSGGTESNKLSKLFAPGTGSWLFEPQISVPIFDAGKNLANIDYAEAEKRSEVATYEKTIQSAFHDVADALAGRVTYVDQVDAEQKLVDADQRYLNLSKLRSDAGVDTYLNVLVAENSLFAAQLTLVSLRLAERQNLLTLYKALGGGWSAHVAFVASGGRGLVARP